jgi:ankyrin repeat protein
MIARPYSRNPVIAAAMSGDIQALKDAIKQVGTKKDINEALLAAVAHGHIRAMHLLFEYGAKVNYRDDQGATAIAWAVQMGHITLFNRLVDQGAALNVRLYDGATLLMLALRFKRDDIIQFLVKKGFKINDECQDYLSQFKSEEKASDEAVVDDLSEATNQEKLVSAVHRGDSEQVKALLNCCDASGIALDDIKRASDLAYKNKNFAVISVFTDFFRKGRCLIDSAENKKFDEMRRLITEEGVYVNLGDSDGITSLMYVAKYDNREAAELLLGKGADVNLKSNGKWTALHAAARHAGWEMCQLLIKAGADVNAVNEQDCKPIQSGGWRRHHGKLIMKCLLEAGTTLNMHKIKEKSQENLLTTKTYSRVIEMLVVCLKENINKLFSSSLEGEAFDAVLIDTNLKMEYLDEQEAEKKAVREALILSIKNIENKLKNEAGVEGLAVILNNMKQLVERLLFIQDDESLKQRLLTLIVSIDSKMKEVFNSISSENKAMPDIQAWMEKINPVSDESKALFGLILNLADRKLADSAIEQLIIKHLLNKPTQTQQNELIKFLTKTLNSEQRSRVKKHLYDAIERWSKEYTLESVEENQDDPASELVIEAIKRYYEDYKKDEIKASEDELYHENRSAHYIQPTLFEILRISEGGRVNANTGTWNDFVNLMKNGNFLKTHPLQSQGVFKNKTKREEKVVKEMKSFTLGT